MESENQCPFFVIAIIFVKVMRLCLTFACLQNDTDDNDFLNGLDWIGYHCESVLQLHDQLTENPFQQANLLRKLSKEYTPSRFKIQLDSISLKRIQEDCSPVSWIPNGPPCSGVVGIHNVRLSDPSGLFSLPQVVLVLPLLSAWWRFMTRSQLRSGTQQ